MPAKQVRFANAKMVYSPEPVVPSPSFSDSSLPSSSGPATPPSPHHHNLPYSYPSHPSYLPFQSYPQPYKALRMQPAIPLRVNRILELSPRPEIYYDISRPPASATTSHGHVLSIRAMSEPATIPPVPYLTITSPHLPWSIPVSSSRPGAFITVADVLHSLYFALRASITGREYHRLPTHDAQRRVKAAYEHRYRRMEDPRAYAEEKRTGARRVDFLMGRTRFMGLSQSPEGPNVWVLNVS